MHYNFCKTQDILTQESQTLLYSNLRNAGEQTVNCVGNIMRI
jgi:hypothetical protein